ncbi:MAG TPA: carbohydrate porin [Daejeonella sp.]|nr:carbohydrate porin [Daejeonella sp.]
MKNLYKYLIALAFIFNTFVGYSQDIKNPTDSITTKDSVASWSVHFQFTNIIQSHPSFKSAYSGRNSFKSTAENGIMSISSSLFIGRKLWKNASLQLNPEITGGLGMSDAKGISAFPNGEVFRIEDPDPKFYVGRIYIQQIFPLKNTGYEHLPSDANQLAGKLPSSRLVINFGKLNMGDYFDDNRYAHDPRNQFFNWALMDQGAWDYPANTRGYTQGLVLELIKPKWELRAASVLLPDLANGPKMDYHWIKSNSTNLEYTRKWNIKKQEGAIRGLLYYQTSKMPSYQAATRLLTNGDPSLENIIEGQAKAPSSLYGGNKYGFGISADQKLNDDLGVFARLGWNDGKHSTWVFTEVDHSASLGASLSGQTWNRPNDTWGLALALSGISKDHQNYLKAGGNGFMLGDGRLNYGPEFLLETYYRAQIHPYVSISLDYQFINHPGYNKDRGPVHVFGVRGHVAF